MLLFVVGISSLTKWDLFSYTNEDADAVRNYQIKFKEIIFEFETAVEKMNVSACINYIHYIDI